MRISLVVAMAENRVIGRDNTLPWRLPADLQHFKALTMGKPIIMGRKTYESIGRALPGRLNIVISRDRTLYVDGVQVVHSIEAALQAAGEHDEVMVIGGADLYAQLLSRADRIYLTRVQAQPDGDAHFPVLEASQWRERECEAHRADERNEFDYAFVVLERR